MNTEDKIKKAAAYKEVIKILAENKFHGEEADRSAIVFLNCIEQEVDEKANKAFSSGDIWLNGSMYSYYNVLNQAMKGSSLFAKAILLAGANYLVQNNEDNPMAMIMAKMLTDEVTYDEAESECHCPVCTARRKQNKKDVNVN